MQGQHRQFTIIQQCIFNAQIPNAIELLKQLIQENIQCDKQFLGLGSLEDQQGFYKSYAIEWLRQQSMKRCISPYDYLCFCFTAIKSYEQAEQWYIDMIKCHPNNYKAIYGLATVYSNAGKHTQAIEHYNTIIKMGKYLDKVYQQIAFIAYFHQHQLAKARQYVALGLSLNTNNLYLIFLRILVEQPFEKKNQLLKDLHSKFPKYTRILNNICKNLIRAQQYDLAIQYLQRCIKADRYYSTPYFNLSIIYEKRNQINKSIENLKICCQLDPQFRYGQIMIARLLYEYLNQYQQAKQYLRQALLYQKSRLAASFQFGKMNNLLKKFQQAAFWFQQCIKINPNMAYFYRSLGIVYQNKRQFNKAIQSYQKALNLNPHCQISLIGLADSYYYFQKYEIAGKYYSDIMQQFPSFVFPEKSYLNYANILVQKSKLSDTIKLLKGAISAYPNKLIFYTTIGHIYLRSKFYMEAREHFQYAKQKYYANKVIYDKSNVEEQAIKQIINYCGIGEDWVKKSHYGILSMKNQIIVKTFIEKYSKLYMTIFKEQQNQADLY